MEDGNPSPCMWLRNHGENEIMSEEGSRGSVKGSADERKSVQRRWGRSAGGGEAEKHGDPC